MLRINYFTFLCCLFCFQVISAQQELVAPCGTSDDVTTDHWLREFQQNPNSFRDLRSNNQMLYIPMTVHVVGTDNGQGFFPEQSIFRAICDMNKQFEHANMFFFIQGPIQYHRNTVWFEHASAQVGTQMYNATRIPNTINCYIDSNANGACGYAYLGSDRMYLRTSCIGPNSATWAHEMGHILTLGHTFRGWEGRSAVASQPAPEFVGQRAVERVDRSNCTVAGDGFCDTEPDYISSRWTCNANRESSQMYRDPDGVQFRVQGAYIMGYANDACMSLFSQDQITAMRVHTLSQKANMVSYEDPIKTRLSSEVATMISPELDQVIRRSRTEFLWEPVENAEGYQVQVSRFTSFSIMQYDTIVQGNSIVLANLQSNRNYFWRVKPISSSDYCQQFTEIRRFRVEYDISTSTQEITGAYISIHPTLIKSGQEIMIDFQLQNPLVGQLNIINVQGQLVEQRGLHLGSGNYKEIVSSTSLPAGVYVIQIRTNDEIYSRKVIIH